jgi:hypothetical protein
MGIASICAVLCFAGPAGAKEWARKMFETTSHDFGTVARGAKAEFDFVLENIYEEDIHIASVRSSCGCTTPSITKDLLKTWEKGAIHAEFNTRSFSGQKNATITVVIDRPFPAEVQLTVSGFIRTDVVFEPGSIEFGDVNSGEKVAEKVVVKYAGRSSWRVLKIQKPAFVDIAVDPPRLDQGNVVYEMVVSLREDAPEGYLKDQILLETNDAQLSRIPFSLAGRVRPALTVSPASITMGVLRPGEKVTKQIVVRAEQPFRVVKVECDSDCFSFKTSESANKLHLIPVTFTANQETGELEFEIRIETDLKQGTRASCLATAIVKEADGAAGGGGEGEAVTIGGISDDIVTSE